MMSAGPWLPLAGHIYGPARMSSPRAARGAIGGARAGLGVSTHALVVLAHGQQTQAFRGRNVTCGACEVRATSNAPTLVRGALQAHTFVFAPWASGSQWLLQVQSSTGITRHASRVRASSAAVSVPYRQTTYHVLLDMWSPEQDCSKTVYLSAHEAGVTCPSARRLLRARCKGFVQQVLHLDA